MQPAIVVELIVDNRVLSLSRREADVALRPMRPNEGDLWGRKLADVAWTFYASRSYIETNGGMACSSSEELFRHPLIGWEEATIGIQAADWLNRQVPVEAVAYRTNSLVNQFVAAKAGIGLALLPCYLGDDDPDLARALPHPILELAGELWIVTHSDLRMTARIRAFFDFVSEGLAREQNRFDGSDTPSKRKHSRSMNAQVEMNRHHDRRRQSL